jgi:hypothetical protein
MGGSHERMTARGIELAHVSVRGIRRDATEAAAWLLGRAAAAVQTASPPKGLGGGGAQAVVSSPRSASLGKAAEWGSTRTL